MKHSVLIIALLLMLAIGVCSAVPTTDAVSGLTNREVTFNAHGGATDCWFEWGGSNTGKMIYATMNDTACGPYTQFGSPLLTSYTYYVKSCDTSGCGSTVSFTTPSSTLSNRTYYGSGVMVMMRSGMNVTQIMGVIITPYTNTMTAPVTWGLLFLFIFLGLWIKPKDVTIPMMLAFIAGGAIWAGTASLGIPPEFADIGQGLMYASTAGLVFSWFSK
jgi:uncharacterized protein YceK